ncbi:glycosyltransferase [Caulobacter sp. 17J80-11]|uniref:glycosyltransferase n=1 Tax=Caulobacter sp. 17J80-11 TaxID=2763502 RepID=UPI0016536490|nr:glycosyltransferase [Caulobacter sp. 17J80-11]MBC6982437.1 glycosyltransferase [Caulobacter sp. 17J80-11]
MVRITAGAGTAGSAAVDTLVDAPRIEAPASALARPPRVSVIIPAYNAATTLDETLESLATQTLSDWEAVVIDDGSTDATAEVAGTWVARDKRVRLVRQANGGVSAARNAGIEQAQGPWLFFLDADDWLHPQALEHLVSAVDARPEIGLAYGSVTRVAPDGVCDPFHCPEKLAADPPGMLRHQNQVAIHVLASRRLVRELGGFDTQLKTSEDWDLQRKIAFSGAAFLRVPEAISYYRMRAGSASMDGVQMLRDAMAVLARNPPPSPAHADDMWENDDFRLTLYAIWCAALEAGAGRDPLGAFKDVDLRLIDVYAHLDGAVECMFDAVRTGGRVSKTQVAREWGRLGPALEPLLARLQHDAGRLGLAQILRYALEERAAREHDEGEPLQVGSTLSVPLDLFETLPDIPAPPGVDNVLLRMSSGPEQIGLLRLPLFGPLPARDLADVLTRFFHRKYYFEINRTLSRPTFWASAALRVPLALVGGLPTPAGLKRRLSDALKAAGHAAAGPAGPGGPTSLTRAAEIVAEEARALAPTAPLRPWPRPSAKAAVLVEHLPVLMYHRVAEDGPADLARYRISPAKFEAQLRWLRDNGWRVIGSEDLAQGLERWTGFPEKAVVLTFDDAYCDFGEAAWPLLKRYGVMAEVFVPVDKVGGMSDWDASYGPPAPLMDWPKIKALADDGVIFGSHLATHTSPDGLSSEALLREATRARVTLEAELGRPIRSIATPHGAWDERISHTLTLAGSTIVYTTEPGFVRLGDQPRRLKRFEVRGDLGLDAFVATLTSGI